MTVKMLKSKIHRAVVTNADIDYMGSITIDPVLLEAAGIYEYEQVQVVNIQNGARIETYTIAGDAKSGIICMNGAAAKLFNRGDKIIIMSYASMSPPEAAKVQPRIVFVNSDNSIKKITHYEKSNVKFDDELT